MKIHNKTVKIGLTITIIALLLILMFHPTFYLIMDVIKGFIGSFVIGWCAGIVIFEIWRDELTKDK